jgi:predicted phosphodiesterase
LARGSSELPILIILGLLLLYAYKKGHLTNILGPGAGGGNGNGNGGGGGGGGAPGSVAFVQFGDPDDSGICENAASHGANTILITGDISKRGDPDGWWESCTGLHDKNVYATIGNHDDDSVVDLFPGNAGAWEFTINLGSIGIVGIDTFNGDESFLTNAVEQFQADAAIHSIVVFGHEPIRAPEGSHHGATNTGYHSIFTANNKVRLVLNGHNHNITVMDVDGIKYVANGSGDPEKYSAGDGDQVEFANDSDEAVTVVKDTGSGLGVEFITNSGESLYSFTV